VNRGAWMIKKRHHKLTDTARRIQTTVSNLSKIMAGNHKPGRRLMRALKREFDIPLDAWDEEVETE